MGAKHSVSSIGLAIFETLNEIFLSISAGLLGTVVLLHTGIKNHQFARTVLLACITMGSLAYVYQNIDDVQPSRNMIVFISGCDSGLGYSMAHHACEMGFTVFAGCLSLDSDGAKQLRNLFGDRVRHIEVDITQSTSIEVAVEITEQFLYSNPDYKLWAIINNAGVMVFGEFEWLTDRLIHNQINVNLAGTFKLTSAFLPLLRQYKGRIINISSHCALATLPGLAVYGATKAAIVAWSDGIRVELNKYGVYVITFIPGSFIQHSNIMANQLENCSEMFNCFTEEQKNFYGDYFKRYNLYLGAISAPKELKKICDPPLYRQFENILLDVPPKTVYIHEPFKYTVYHMLFKYAPVRARDYLVTRFMQMPDYYPPEETSHYVNMFL